MKTFTKTKQKISTPTGIIVVVWIAATVLAISAFILSIITGLFRLFG